MAERHLAGRVRAFLEINLPTYLETLRQMVAINSFTANPAGVNELGQVTAELFAQLGFSAEMIPSVNPENGNHLIMTRSGSSQQRIGLVSHLDTVFPPQEEMSNDFHWRREGDRIYGPGTVDIKGGTVLIYMVLAALQEEVPDLYESMNWVVLVDASEEDDAEDFGRICRERLEGAETLACLIFEGGYQEKEEFWVVRMRKGMAVYEVNVEGKAAHAGTSHNQGANAIVQMAHTIQKLAEMTDYDKRVTVNVGVVSGGTVTNRVPHFAQAKLEMRTFDSGLYESVMADIASLSNHSVVRSNHKDYPCQVSIRLLRKTAPWPVNEATDRLISIWQKVGATLGYRVLPEERGGLSDGNLFWHCFPTLDGLGVAGGNAHCSERSANGSKDQEYCQVSSFVPKALLNVLSIIELVRQARA
jgi:glutamate carboxypeptidase